MASSSLPHSLPSSSLSRSWEHDVFPSFHGPDVRNTFLSHIQNEFQRKGIYLFIDNEITRGKPIGPELKRAIQESKIAIVLLSKNYASSSWCLDELVEIMSPVVGQTVMTIFYDVDPTDVKKQTGDFGKVFEETCQGKTMEKFETWRKALEGVATIAGYHTRNWVDEAAMIENIAADILKKLNRLAPSPHHDRLIGIGAHMKRMKLLLSLDLNEVRMIGIWGPPGIGKTTIAKCLFHKLSNSFQFKAIMLNIKGNSPKVSMSIVHNCNYIYKVDFPPDDEALHMFCMYAFGQKSPKDGFTEMCREITYLVGKLPLALKVTGSYFRGMPKQEWKRELPKLWSRLNGEIESILKFSYDALFEEDKDLFLHIACFFNREYVKTTEEHLAKFFDVKHGLQALADKSLISIERDRIEMHSLLAQLGKEIVRKQSNRKPGKRQFLVDLNDIGEVFTDPTSITRSVIGICYNSDDQIWNDSNISETAFERMSNLQFLRLDGNFGRSNIASVAGSLKYISPKLQLLDWENSRMTSLPFIVNLEFLVELRMRGSQLEKMWEGIKLLKNLKRMDLHSSKHLKELPNLSNATKLEELNLSYCFSLVKLPSSIGNATNLRFLNLNNCPSLVELPSSIRNAINLQTLYLEKCSSLTKLPSSIENAANLQKIYLSKCSSLVELHSSIENATNLEELHLEYCSSLVELPSSVGNLHRLKRLNLEGCSKLEVLPTNINLESLEDLNLTNCSSLESFPELSTNITYLMLRGTAIEEVPLSIRSWSRLRDLHMSYCEKLQASPHALDRITKLHLSDSEIQGSRGALV